MVLRRAQRPDWRRAAQATVCATLFAASLYFAREAFSAGLQRGLPRHRGTDLRHRRTSRTVALALADEELWLDLRDSRAKHTDQFGNVQTEPRAAKAVLLELYKNVKAKLEALRLEMPQGEGVNALLTTEEDAKILLEEADELGLPVYYACEEVGGVKMEGNALYVCDADDASPFGLTQYTSGGYTIGKKNPVMSQVWELKVNQEVAKEVSPEEVQALLDDEADWEKMEIGRLMWIMGASKNLDGKTVEDLLPKGEPMARGIPPDTMLWAQALIQKAKQSSRAEGE